MDQSQPHYLGTVLATHMHLPLHHRTLCFTGKQRMIQTLLTMDQRRPPEYIIEVFASPESVKDVVRGLMRSLSRLRHLTLTLLRRHITHDIFPQILPFYSTKDPRCTRLNPSICRRCRAGDLDRSKDSNTCSQIRHELGYGREEYGSEGADGGPIFREEAAEGLVHQRGRRSVLGTMDIGRDFGNSKN